MNVSVLYHPNSDHERAVLTYERDFKQRTGRDLKLISLETVEGSELAKRYDITTYPAILATTNDGKLVKYWQDQPLPLIDELSYYSQDEANSSYRL